MLANNPKTNASAIFKLSLLGCGLISLMDTSPKRITFAPFSILKISLLTLMKFDMNVSDEAS